MPELTLLQLVVVTLVVGVLLYLLGMVPAVDARAKQIIYWGAIIILVILWLIFILQLVGLSI